MYPFARASKVKVRSDLRGKIGLKENEKAICE